MDKSPAPADVESQAGGARGWPLEGPGSAARESEPRFERSPFEKKRGPVCLGDRAS
jgi:hypothetical protein